MKTINYKKNPLLEDETIFRNIFKDLFYKGFISNPRGLMVMEIENYNYTLLPYQRFCNFKSRKLNIDYIKNEFLWYLRGNKFDLEILKHAKLWNELVNKDSSINSNYGQYIFGENNGFNRVVEILKNDKDSRRASIMILNNEHLKSDTKDFPCTYSINFRIRNNKLNMTVRMRSQDLIFGLGNDAPSFSFIHEMLFVTLKNYYKDLEYGIYYHSADSFHIYKRHFELLEKVINGDDYKQIKIPRISGKDEVYFLLKLNYTNIPKKYLFTKWLTSK